jgi:hypothetical protein
MGRDLKKFENKNITSIFLNNDGVNEKEKWINRVRMFAQQTKIVGDDLKNITKIDDNDPFLKK